MKSTCYNKKWKENNLVSVTRRSKISTRYFFIMHDDRLFYLSFRSFLHLTTSYSVRLCLKDRPTLSFYKQIFCLEQAFSFVLCGFKLNLFALDTKSLYTSRRFVSWLNLYWWNWHLIFNLCQTFCLVLLFCICIASFFRQTENYSFLIFISHPDIVCNNLTS